MFYEIEKYAKEFNVPIVDCATKDFIVDYVKENDIKHILEIGSAIGYFAIVVASIDKNINVFTIEKDHNRYNIAVENIKKYNLEKQIEIINDDALTYELKCNHKYDLIFIDAAKAQYQKFLVKYSEFLTNNGIIIVDNINFHGFVDGSKVTNNRNTKQLVNKIKKFNNWITTNELYDVEYFDIGDGIFVIKRKI